MNALTPVILKLPIAIAPVIVPPLFGSLVPNDVVIPLAYEASSSIAAASSLRVSNAPGAPPIKSVISVCTYAVVAILVELLFAACVGAVGFPVSAADENIVAFDSFVTLPKPTSPAVVACALNLLYVPSLSNVSPDKLNVVPLNDNPVPAEYVVFVLVSVDVIVMVLASVLLTVVAPAPTNFTSSLVEPL